MNFPEAISLMPEPEGTRTVVIPDEYWPGYVNWLYATGKALAQQKQGDATKIPVWIMASREEIEAALKLMKEREEAADAG